MHNYYKEFIGEGQQKIELYLYESRLPKDDPVYTLKELLNELNYSKLLSSYSKYGRKGYNPIMIFALIIYANMQGIFSVDKIVQQLSRDIGFIWLAQGQEPKRDVFYDFINDRLTEEILEDLHYQFVRRLAKAGYVTLKKLYIDGTKIEANANRYTFVWRGSINYHLANLLDGIDQSFSEYNELIERKGYDKKYKLSPKEMLVIEGMEKVKAVIKDNRIRKKNNKKKRSNNTIIEIDNMSPIDLIKTAKVLRAVCEEIGISFVDGKGQKRSEEQKLHDKLINYGNRLLKYKEKFEIMGRDRNSYSKTDIEATFMRMKDDHMLNGQLKAAYNVQYAVENYFIIHTHVSDDRTDYNTLIPVTDKHRIRFGEKTLEEMIADSGYCSEKNLDYLARNEIASFIKLQEHEKKKTKAYHQKIGKYYNMTKTEVGFICHDGRLLNHIGTEEKTTDGFKRAYEIYSCESCSACSFKAECLYKFDPEKHQDKNKLMKINERWDELKSISEANVLSDEGINHRQVRSVMCEGSFGDMKENDKFKRFHRRGTEGVKKEIMLYAFARNVNKLHRYQHELIENFKGNHVPEAA